MKLMHHLSLLPLFIHFVSYSIAIRVPADIEDISQIAHLLARENQPTDKSLTRVILPQINIPKDTSTPEECARNCNKRPKRKTCYYKFTVEQYTSMGGACRTCRRNETNNCQCITADGVDRTIFAVNRMLPGPSIEVCRGDTVIVDVLNHMDGTELTIHWHGVLQHGTPYSDGVPFVTQCPIHQGNQFRYKWKADNPGTHFYHAHTGFQKVDGVIGNIIIREKNDVQKPFYDIDRDVIMISDWMHELANERFPGRLIGKVGQYPDNILINGKGKFPGSQVNTPLEVFHITRTKRSRFRMINAFGTDCPAQIFVEDHRLLVITTDGYAVKPVIVDSIVSSSAERFDFVVAGVQSGGAFWVQIKAVGFCEKLKMQQLAILQYSNGPETPDTPPPTYDNGLPEGKVLNPVNASCGHPSDNTVCISELLNAEPTDLQIGKVPDVKLYIPFRLLFIEDQELFKPNTYIKFLVAEGHNSIGLMDGISYDVAPAPLLSQYKDIHQCRICNSNEKPSCCEENCACTHIVRIPLHALVEVILVDEIGIENLSHPIHLHGYSFHLVGEGHLPNQNEKIDLRKAIEYDIKEKIPRRMEYAPRKDTIAVPPNGYSVFRFIADNPGFWFFHCHFMYHMSIGMEMVFQVGELSDLPKVPRGFPKCGNFLPDY